MDKDELKQLFQRYLNGECSQEDLLRLKSVLSNPGQEEQIKSLLDSSWDNLDKNELTDVSREKAESIYSEIISRKKNTQNSRVWLKIAATVTIFIFLGVGLHRIYKNNPSEDQASNLVQEKAEKIVPGGNKAVLTLADGSKVILNDVNNGHLASQDNVEIQKTDDGQIVYSVKGTQTLQKAQLIAISTPRGGQYEIILPDGSKVWLNAESSLKYPVYFSGKERIVEMTGEAYFEVARNNNMPFKVIANAAEIKVLGTHFNVMAYDNERFIETTLLEGSVNVNNRVLKPGQKAQMNKVTNSMSISAADTEEAVAWKNGFFMFKNENIQSIMRKIGRWYDVETEFKGKNTMHANYGGTISRFEDVSEVHKIMELTGVIHFKIEGRRILVMP